MRKIIIFFSVLLFISFEVNAQTLATTTSQPTVGDNINVPIIVNSIGDVYTLTVYLEYDNSALTYTGFANQMTGLTISVEAEGSNAIKILVGEFPTASTVPDGTLLDLQFDYNGGYSDLKFWTTTYGTYSSNMLIVSPYSTFNFTDADVTNGAAQGYFDNTISGGDWNTATNWSAGRVSNTWANVTVASGTETTIASAATANDLTIEQGGKLTLNDALTVDGDFIVESTAAGNGSFINSGTFAVTGSTTIQSFVTSGKWHGIASPVVGLTADDLYLGGSPDVWLKSYDEATDTYTNITSLATPLGTMEGWMTWIETGASDVTYNFTGALNASPVSKSMEYHAGFGYNFVGNPYSSAIDWDASSGWTKTSVNNAIYVYNNGGWATYIGGTSVNGGSQYIAMNQGFFVQANAASGELAMTDDVCVHNVIPFRNTKDLGEIIRLQIIDGELVDESVIRFIDGATTEFDGNFDAHKFFSFNEDYPQIYSTANSFMSINSLPVESTDAIGMDVVGVNGNEMTISLTEVGEFDNVYLEDEFTGTITDLKTASYTFNYNSDITNRFNLFFSVTGIDTPTSNDDVRIFAYDKNIQVVLDGLNNSNITVYNLMGQKITSREANSAVTVIPVNKSGYYVVKVSDGKYVSSQKVYIK